jgi:hypothetical protein
VSDVYSALACVEASVSCESRLCSVSATMLAWSTSAWRPPLEVALLARSDQALQNLPSWLARPFVPGSCSAVSTWLIASEVVFCCPSTMFWARY